MPFMLCPQVQRPCRAELVICKALRSDAEAALITDSNATKLNVLSGS
jgi:hypothetical protein